MINIAELSSKIYNDGYSEEIAEAKLCQDIILLLLSKSKFNRNITIKGGVVISSISKNIRRATIDIDLDLIKSPLTDDFIYNLVKEIDGIEGVKVKIVGEIEELKHQDYNGKRVYIDIEDSFNNYLSSKIDVGVHKYLSIMQDEYCFDIFGSCEGAVLLVNSKEQMFTEKLKSLLRFGPLSTRFKDIYDMYFLIDKVRKKELLNCFNILIFDDVKIRERTVKEVIDRIRATFKNTIYLNNLITSDKNWVEVENSIVLNSIIEFLESLE